MYLYLVIKEHIVSDNNTESITYGIKVLFCTCTHVTEKLRIHDISTDYDMITRIAALCTNEQLDPVHLPDIVQDMIL